MYIKSTKEIQLKKKKKKKGTGAWCDLLASYHLMVNIQNTLERQLLEIEAVALVEVGADRLRVVVHHHCALAHVSEGADTGHGTPVELHTAAWNTRENRTGPTFTHHYKHFHKGWRLHPSSAFSKKEYGSGIDSALEFE